MNKLLIVGPAWVGDMVMAQSLFKLLKGRDPQLVIDVLAPAWSEPLLACMPEIRKALIAPFAHGELHLRERYQLGKQLRAEKYDQAIVLPNSFKSALIPFFAKIPRRTGWLGELRWGILNDVRHLNKNALPKMIERFAALGLSAQAILPTQLPFPALQVNAAAIQQTLTKFSLSKTAKPILAICPGAEYGPAKRWPAAHFAALAKQKKTEGWDIWIFGSAKDSVIASEIQMACGNICRDLTGKTSLGEAINLLATASVVVTNDSGLMHIAAALQKPLIALYGSSSPSFTPPLSERVKILSLNLACSPCFKRECPLGHLNCLKQLQPEKVITALNELQHESINR